jgi:hypothetical protein
MGFLIRSNVSVSFRTRADRGKQHNSRRAIESGKRAVDAVS